MKSDGRNILSSVVSEWEDNVLFDADDPDFAKSSTSISLGATNNLNVLNAYMLKGKLYNLRTYLMSSVFGLNSIFNESSRNFALVNLYNCIKYTYKVVDIFYEK